MKYFENQFQFQEQNFYNQNQNYLEMYILN